MPDTYSGRTVGWYIANNLRTELILDAVDMAIHTQRPQPGSIRRSDRGSQYTPMEFGSRPKEARLLPSMGSVADAYDNSMAEGLVSTLKRELVHLHSWPSARRRPSSTYIERGVYNIRRKHSALGNLSSREYEEAKLTGGAAA